MKKSKSVILGTLALAAATVSMAGCNDEPQQDVRSCTDKNGQIVDDRYCQAQPQTASGQNPSDQIIRDILIYHWVFGGSFDSRRGYVYGGGYRPVSPSVIYVSPYSSTGSSIRSAGSARSYSSVSRGGFGGSFGGGHGESGGE